MHGDFLSLRKSFNISELRDPHRSITGVSPEYHRSSTGAAPEGTGRPAWVAESWIVNSIVISAKSQSAQMVKKLHLELAFSHL